MTRALLCLMALFVSTQALAQQTCFPRAPFIAMLAAQYGETVLFEAIMEPDGGKPVPIVLFAAPLGRTWTLATRINPNVLCPVLKGSAFEPPGPDRLETPPA